MAPSLKSLNQGYTEYILVIAITSFFCGIFFFAFFSSSKHPVISVVASAFIQLGITLVVVDLFIRRIAGELLQTQINHTFRTVLGVENPNSKLFPELVSLIQPHPYHILDINIETRLFYTKNKSELYNLGSIEKTSVKVQAKEDNANYHFTRGTDSGIDKQKILSIKIDGKNLHLKRDFRIEEEGKLVRYTIKQRLKKDVTYNFEIVYQTSNSMSDLKNDQINEDFHKFRFIELTNKAKITLYYPFDISNYTFITKKTDNCRREQSIEFQKTKNSIVITEQNLRNGDEIDVTYTKFNEVAR